jgi:hypothetical protein
LFNLANLVVLITFALVAIAYMIGRALENPKVLQWSETELTQVIGTAVILMVFMSLTAILDTTVGPTFYNQSVIFPADTYRTSSSYQQLHPYGGWATVQDHVQHYLESDLEGTLSSLIYGFSTLSAMVGAISSMSFSIQVSSSLSIFFTPFAATFGPIQSVLATVFNAVVISAAQLQIQLEIIKLNGAIFTILLPLGLIFRAFPFTRPAGGALISIAFGFTIMLPIAYLVTEDIALHLYGPGGRPSGDTLAGQITQIAFSVSSANEMQTFFTNGFAEGGVLRQMAKFLVIEVTLLPLMAYLMVLNITRNLAEIFGAHIDFSTLVRMI